MKHFTLLSSFVLGLFLTATITFGQESAFDREVKPWHKKATMTCGMLRDMKTFDPAKMLSNLNKLEAGLKVLSEKVRQRSTQGIFS